MDSVKHFKKWIQITPKVIAVAFHLWWQKGKFKMLGLLLTQTDEIWGLSADLFYTRNLQLGRERQTSKKAESNNVDWNSNWVLNLLRTETRLVMNGNTKCGVKVKWREIGIMCWVPSYGIMKYLGRNWWRRSLGMSLVQKIKSKTTLRCLGGAV